jgi:hypothetical protein
LATLVYPQLLKRAKEGTRTPDLLITNQWLYQLSYFGLFLFFKERPFNFGIANLERFFVVAKKNKNFFNFFLISISFFIMMQLKTSRIILKIFYNALFTKYLHACRAI